MIDERYGFPPDFDFRDIEDDDPIQYGPNGEILDRTDVPAKEPTDLAHSDGAGRPLGQRRTTQ